MLIPMVVGLLVMSIVSGIIASRTAHYKWLPTVGTLVTAVGMILLSTLTAGTSLALVGTYLFLLGAGLGMTQQMLVLIVQPMLPPTRSSSSSATRRLPTRNPHPDAPRRGSPQQASKAGPIMSPTRPSKPDYANANATRPGRRSSGPPSRPSTNTASTARPSR